MSKRDSFLLNDKVYKWQLALNRIFLNAALKTKGSIEGKCLRTYKVFFATDSFSFSKGQSFFLLHRILYLLI